MPRQFGRAAMAECQANIEAGQSFNLVSLPGVGVSYFVRFLSGTPPNFYVHINTYEMPEFSKQELFRQLAVKCNPSLKNVTPEDLEPRNIRQSIEQLCQKHKRVVIIFNRFDRLAHTLDQNLIDNLHFLKGLNRNNCVMIFVTARPLTEAHGAHSITTLLPKTVYFKPYAQADLQHIARLDGLPYKAPKTLAALNLAGGHHALFHTLYRCQDIHNPLSDSQVEMQIKQILAPLGARQNEELRALVSGKSAKLDQYLTDSGLVKPGGDGSAELFSPLVSRYILQAGSFRLPHKERQLLSLLKANKGRMVRKQEIMDKIWGDEVASDWSLNSLVYRLRRHPAFDNRRMAIKSIKKEGYMLIES